MNEKDVLKTMIARRQMTQGEFAKKLGYKTQSAVSTKLSGNSMRVDTLIKFLNALDCSIVIIDNLSKDAYMIDNDVEQEQIKSVKLNDLINI